jgi:hypothetical protein
MQHNKNNNGALINNQTLKWSSQDLECFWRGIVVSFQKWTLWVGTNNQVHTHEDLFIQRLPIFYHSVWLLRWHCEKLKNFDMKTTCPNLQVLNGQNMKACFELRHVLVKANCTKTTLVKCKGSNVHGNLCQGDKSKISKLPCWVQYVLST